MPTLDRTTKFLLYTIALGIWGTLLRPLLPGVPAHAAPVQTKKTEYRVVSVDYNDLMPSYQMALQNQIDSYARGGWHLESVVPVEGIPPFQRGDGPILTRSIDLIFSRPATSPF